MRFARLAATIVSIAALSAPIPAFAQPGPTGIDAGAPPSYARPANPNGEEIIQGRVTAYDGKYSLQVNDDRGYVDNVELRQGTIINPTGLRLQPGMRVTVLGYNRGHFFAANQIDTPYQSYGFAYPAYPAYGYYPGYSIGIGFGPVFYHRWR